MLNTNKLKIIKDLKMINQDVSKIEYDIQRKYLINHSFTEILKDILEKSNDVYTKIKLS